MKPRFVAGLGVVVATALTFVGCSGPGADTPTALAQQAAEALVANDADALRDCCYLPPDAYADACQHWAGPQRELARVKADQYAGQYPHFERRLELLHRNAARQGLNQATLLRVESEGVPLPGADSAVNLRVVLQTPIGPQRLHLREAARHNGRWVLLEPPVTQLAPEAGGR